METKSETVRVRIEPSVKKAAEAVFAELGLSVSDAVGLFYRQVKAQKRIPLSLNIPNAETVKALKQVKARKGLKRYKTEKELFDKLR